MGGACCVAARDKTIVSAPGSEVLHRNIRHSPTWSFRWENRGRVAGEETSISWFSDGNSRNGGSDMKYESAYVSEDGSPLESFGRQTWHKSPVSDGTAVHARTPAADQSISRNMSTDASSDQVKELLAESPAVSNLPLTKLSVSLPSTSSLSTSPLSSQNQSYSASLTMSRWHSLIGKVSDSQLPELKSSNSYPVAQEKPSLPSWSNESTRGSYGGSSDGWSMQMFPELLAAPHRESWSFDTESVNLNDEGSRPNAQVSGSYSVDLPVCGICTKLLSEKSFWSGQKLVVSNELSVVGVLICGHVYHAECLETMTPEISKYDPSCPICTLGEKQTLKLSQKAMKAELDMKARNKRSRSRVVDGNFDGDPFMFDSLKSSRHKGKDPKMASSSSMKSSSAKFFLTRHFSFGLKNQTTKRRGLFWTRSMKG